MSAIEHRNMQVPTMASITLTQADCLQFLQQQPDNSVDLIVSDPPYFRFLATAWDRQWRTRDDYLAWLDHVLAEYRRVLKPCGSLYLFASPRMAAWVECRVAGHFNVLNHIVWRKHSGPHGKACKEQLRAFFPQTERIIFAEPTGAEKHWQQQCAQIRKQVFAPLRQYLRSAWQASGVSVADIERATGTRMHGHWFGASQWTMPTEAAYRTLQALFNGHLNRDWSAVKAEYEALAVLQEKARATAQRRQFAVSKHVPFTDVWDFNPTPPRPGRHPCEKPLPLIEHIITTSSLPGDVVMDTFAGSGTTAVAAARLGRHFIGCELGEKEFLQATARLATETG